MARTYSDTVTTPAAAAAVTGGSIPFVSLLSDFGLRDPSAGIMRAVVLGICRDATVVDLGHEVDKFAIRDGALLLWSAVPYMPIGAHVAVIDPGVGTARKGIAMKVARGDHLVGPDNGLLMPAAARLGGIVRVHLLENPRYSLSPVSTSFHGRDVFAPAAAHLAAGVSIEELGREVDPRRLLELDWPRPDIRPGRLGSHAIYIDTFGNVKLSALADDLKAALPDLRLGERLILRVGEGAAAKEIGAVWVSTFGNVEKGAPLLYTDSYGRVCLAVYQGSAADAVGVELDVAIELTRAPGEEKLATTEPAAMRAPALGQPRTPAPVPAPSPNPAPSPALTTSRNPMPSPNPAPSPNQTTSRNPMPSPAPAPSPYVASPTKTPPSPRTPPVPRTPPTPRPPPKPRTPPPPQPPRSRS
jgi:S-adenosylmethionine hydrolase